MKTFTTYAEKKAKQILNLLQGYTKGIRITAILILLLMGVSNASAVDLYLRGIRTWDAKDQTKMSQNGSTYSVITYLSTVTYKFKIADSGWNYGNNYEANNTSATVSLNTAYSTWHSNGKGDMSFTPSTAGFYKFSLNTSDSKLTISKYNPSPEEAPSDVVNGTNVMFYIQGYSDNGYNVLRANSSNSISSNSHGLSKIDYSISYVNTKKTNLSTNYYISNNPSDWNGKSYTDIKNAQGGELFEAQDSNNKTNAKTATTTTSVANTTLNISTTTESKTGVCNGTLYIQYYINNNFTGVTYNSSTASYASISANGATAHQSTLDISDYANGTYTLKTILTDGIIYYIADTDEFTVNNAKRHDVTISYLYNSTSIKTSTKVSVSESTATTITAPAIEGYKFSSWTLGTGIFNKSANTTVNPISITTKESGVYTLTANYVEDLTSTWYIAGTAGNGSPFTGWGTSGTKMYKKTGHSTEKKYYCTFEVTTTASSDDQFEFQAYNSSNGSYYGYNNFWITQANNSTKVYTGNPTNMKFRPYVTGTYEFELDCTGSNPVLTVTWPSFNQIRFYSAQTGGNTITTYDWENTNTNTWTKEISLTKGTHYFKVLENSEFLGNNGTMTRNSCTNWIMEADKNNCGITADFAGEYLFTYDKSTNKLTVTYPTAYTVTYGIGNNKGTDVVTTDPSITSGSLVLPSTSITFSKGVTKPGYTWKNWNSKADGTGTNLGTDDTYVSSNRTGDITVYAYYDLITYNITYNLNGGTGATNTTYNVTTATITLPSPSKTGYNFAGWYDNEGLTGNAVTQIAQGSTGHKVFWAKWNANTYTVIFNKNANDATGTMTNQSFTYDEAAKPLTANAFTRTGYTFTGWNTNANGSGIAYNDGQSVQNLTDDNNGTINLYAQWTESQAKHDVRVLYMCGDVVVKDEETIAVGEILPTSITAPAITGYTFSEWKLGDGLVTENNLTAYTINLKTKSSGDYTLTANYIKYQYTLTFGVLGYGGSVSAIADGNEIASPAPLGQDSKVTLTATAKDGYVFHKWINSTGAEVSEANPYEHTMTESTTINAVFKNTRMLYLKLNDKWSRELNNGVWFAAYFFNTSNENYWVKMSTEKACENNGYYKTPIPEGNWTNVIFVRMNKDNQTWLSFDNKWDKTIDLTIPKDGKNLFTLYNDHEGDNCNGTWSAHTSTYEPEYLTYNVEVPAGTPNCYISGEINGWSFTEMEKVDDTHYTITIQDACPDDEYKYCYGPSWGCQEVKQSDFTAINNRTHKNSDKVEAWIKYCIVGQDLGNWDWIDHFEFDLDGDINSLTHHLNQNTNGYKFKVKSSIGEYYTTDSQDGNKHIFHSMHTSEKIPQTAGDWHELILKVDVAGDHHFLFDPVSKLLTIEFPEKGYRLKITMTDGSRKVYTSNAVNNENETLSFFAPGANDPKLSGIITLEYEGQTISSFTEPNITESGVYTAKLNSAKNGITDIALYNGNYYIRTDGAYGGWGNYKTDSDNKMTYFVPREEEKYSYYWVSALPRGERNTSNGVVNVKACVANDYNDNLATMLEADKFTSDNYGNVNILDPDEHHLEKINVRFGYNPKTNHFERAMLTGSGNINTFLNIFDPLPEGHLYKTYHDRNLETRLTAAGPDNKFTDVSNWVYERDVWVDVPESEDVTVCLTAVSYNGARNSLFGFDDDAFKVPTQRTIVGAGSTPGPKKMRVIYDFKTNRMIMAWMPSTYECTEEEVLNADVLFMRHENELVPQLTMKDNNTSDSKTPKIAGIQSQFFAMEFDKYEKNQLLEEQYWITLPFNCVVGSISGVPGYMQTWGIQRYNGKKRAEKGWWKETETFWEWLGPDDVMEAGVGYVLSFDKSAATWNTFDVHEEDANGNVISTTQKSLLRLYFPSTEKGFTFKATNEFEKEYVNEPCTIQTADRYKQDGNWKIIGPLSYNSASASPEHATEDVWKPEKDSTHIDVPDGEYTWDQPMFLYEFWQNDSDRSEWKYIVKSANNHTYQAFYGYMVQFAGTITWSEITQSTHSALRARTYTDQVPTNITTNLDLVDAEGVQHDQTFVSLDIEGTTTYDLNKDLNKVFNNNFANIYTLSENIPFAGNTLPMEKAIVPVGVRIATAGEYTFRMPDGTEGIYVTLIDSQTGTQTDMLMSEYTVMLDAGTIENRFYLVVDPDRAATSVENIGEDAKGEEAKDQIKKFLIDGQLFIRTADGIFDAKGQRM